MLDTKHVEHLSAPIKYNQVVALTEMLFTHVVGKERRQRQETDNSRKLDLAPLGAICL